MNKYHGGSLIHRVCIEYVRLPSHYYRPFIIGGPTTKASQAGNVLTQFMQILHDSNKLSPGCSLQFARHPSDGRWNSAIENYEKVSGEVQYVRAERNPLYVAGEQTQSYLNQVLEHPFDHRFELAEPIKNGRDSR